METKSNVKKPLVIELLEKVINEVFPNAQIETRVTRDTSHGAEPGDQVYILGIQNDFSEIIRIMKPIESDPDGMGENDHIEIERYVLAGLMRQDKKMKLWYHAVYYGSIPFNTVAAEDAAGYAANLDWVFVRTILENIDSVGGGAK